MLTEEEWAALERLRTGRYIIQAGSVREGIRRETEDLLIAREIVLRLFPAGHEAEITPERLIACGAVQPVSLIRWNDAAGERIVSCSMELDWWVRGMSMPDELAPRNMGEVWQLLERCGLPVTKGGE